MSGVIKFSSGLLPGSAQAQSYSDDRKAKQVTCFGTTFSAGLFYLQAGTFSIGIDTNLRELGDGGFWRAVFAEFAAAMWFLFFVVTTIVYRRDFASKPGLANEELVRNVGTLGASAQLVIAASFGTMITVLVYGLAPVSGGHINPAISISLAILRKITAIRCICYVAAQVGGALVGTIIAASLNWSTYADAGGGANGVGTTFGWREILTAEFMATALLVFVVNCAIDAERAGSVLHIGALGPLAIGAAVFVAHLGLLPIDGCGRASLRKVNPARSFATAAVSGNWQLQVVYWFGPIAGGLAASFFYELILRGRKSENAPRYDDDDAGVAVVREASAVKGAGI